MAEQMTTTRREFLVRSTATAAGAFLSIGLPSMLQRGTAEAAATATFTPSIWFTLTPDGTTTMHIVKAEMGQHIGTALAQIIAEELEVRWEDVRLDTPLESVENFAIYGLAYTVNSGSVTTEFDRLSRAGNGFRRPRPQRLRAGLQPGRQRHAADALRFSLRRRAGHAAPCTRFAARLERLVRRRRTDPLSPGSRTNTPRRASVGKCMRLAPCRARSIPATLED